MATNRKFAKGSPLSVAVASPTLSGDPIVLGVMGGGVALTDYDSVTGKATVDFDGVYDLSVKGSNAAGNVTVTAGDAIYYNSAATPVLNKDARGVFFGYALEAVDSGATTTIMVRLAQGGAGSNSFANQGIFVSDEVTGTGSSQNTAHGLGTAPTKAVVTLTEFLSNQSVDVTEGTHTSTNAVFTVTNNVKYRVIAWK